MTGSDNVLYWEHFSLILSLPEIGKTRKLVIPVEQKTVRGSNFQLK